MKCKLLVAVVVSLMYSTLNFGQVIEITPSYGYQFGSRISYGPTYFKVKSSAQYGITVGVETVNDLMAEFTYTNMSSELRFRDFDLAPTEVRLADLNADWFLLGVSRYFKTGKVKPFAGGGLGLVVVSTKNENREILENNISNSTNFAFNFKAGVNIMFSDVIGLNLQGNLYFPVNWAGVYIGPGGAGISTGSTVILGSISGGLVFRIDND